MDYNDEDITAETLMNKFLGKGNRKRYLIELIKEESHYGKSKESWGTYGYQTVRPSYNYRE